MNDKERTVLKILFRLAVTIVLLAIVTRSIDLNEVWRAALHVRLPYLAVVFTLYAFSFWVRSYRFRLILKLLDLSVSTLKIFLASSVTMLYSLGLPGLASTGVKWYILKEHTGKASHVLSCMAYNQVSEMVVKVLIGCLAIIGANPSSNVLLPIVCAVIVIVVVLSSLLLLNPATGPVVYRSVKAMFRPFPAKIRKYTDKILGQLQVFQTVGWSFHLKMLVICLFASGIGILIYLYAAKAAGISVPVSVLAWQCSVVFVLGRLPITLANLGLREWALVGFLAAYGVPKSDAFLMSMGIFSGVLFIAALGAACQIVGPFRRSERSSPNSP